MDIKYKNFNFNIDPKKITYKNFNIGNLNRRCKERKSITISFICIAIPNKIKLVTWDMGELMIYLESDKSKKKQENKHSKFKIFGHLCKFTPTMIELSRGVPLFIDWSNIFVFSIEKSLIC